MMVNNLNLHTFMYILYMVIIIYLILYYLFIVIQHLMLNLYNKIKINHLIQYLLSFLLNTFNVFHHMFLFILLQLHPTILQLIM